MRLAQLARSDEVAQHFRGGDLAALAARLMDSFIECDRSSEQRLERHRSGELRRAPETLRAREREHANSGVSLRAVDQRNSSFWSERQRLESDGAEYVERRATNCIDENVSVADQRQ